MSDVQATTRPDQPVVVYLAGWGRSGSTLLETLLADEGAVCVGETFQLWTSSPLARFCSCGDALAECPVWRHAVQAFAEPWDRVVAEMRSIRWRYLRMRYLPQLIGRRRWAGTDAVRRYGEVMATVYSAVAEATGATEVIDSSKLPLDLAAAARANDRLRVVHLIRDPRAVAASWKRRVSWAMPDGSQLHMPTHSAWSAAARWDLYHAATAAVVRGLRLPAIRISYESLVRLDPRSIDELARFTGEPGLGDRIARAAGGGLEVPVQHAIAGNPGRSSGATLVLREDDGWAHELSRAERLQVTALGLPYAATRRTRVRAGG